MNVDAETSHEWTPKNSYNENKEPLYDGREPSTVPTNGNTFINGKNISGNLTDIKGGVNQAAANVSSDSLSENISPNENDGNTKFLRVIQLLKMETIRLKNFLIMLTLQKN